MARGFVTRSPASFVRFNGLDGNSETVAESEERKPSEYDGNGSSSDCDSSDTQTPKLNSHLLPSYSSSSTSLHYPPWNASYVQESLSRRKRKNKARFRQHANPLARVYQVPTHLSSDIWPQNVFHGCLGSNKPLHLDIGCGKGGFLLSLAKHEEAKMNQDEIKNNYVCEDDDDDDATQACKSASSFQYKYNYLGLELRPLVAQYAKNRISVHNLTGVVEFIGCNANVDLDRLLQLYHESCTCSPSNASLDSNSNDDVSTSGTTSTPTSNLLLERVTIQFPDPHFKTHHAKRRVVTEELVDTLARYMPPRTGVVFLQSDVQKALDDMRQVFGKATDYFQDSLSSAQDYLSDNYLGVPTEREISVLERNLPVYRCLFYRTDVAHPESFRRTR
ncbi:hypothetical protein ACA910_015996 [Epithemia clementina (nom. ined.)]